MYFSYRKFSRVRLDAFHGRILFYLFLYLCFISDLFYPTADDLTKETVAACYGDTLVFDESEWEKITGYFARSGRVTTPNNRKQAMVPVKGHKIINHHGTAPGAWFEQEGRCAVLMPGVPGEMKAMWNETRIRCFRSLKLLKSSL